jgi:hypothetical protein
VPVHLKGVRVERSRRFGDVYLALALALWRGIGLEELCERLHPAGQERTARSKTAAMQVAAREAQISAGAPGWRAWWRRIASDWQRVVGARRYQAPAAPSSLPRAFRTGARPAGNARLKSGCFSCQFGSTSAPTVSPEQVPTVLPREIMNVDHLREDVTVPSLGRRRARARPGGAGKRHELVKSDVTAKTVTFRSV